MGTKRLIAGSFSNSLTLKKESNIAVTLEICSIFLDEFINMLILPDLSGIFYFRKSLKLTYLEKLAKF